LARAVSGARLASGVGLGVGSARQGLGAFPWPPCACRTPGDDGERDDYLRRLGSRLVLVLVVFASGYLGARLSLLHAPAAQASHNFGDVPDSAFYHDYVDFLVNNGITSGCSVTPPLYCGEAPVTRGEMAVFLKKLADLVDQRVTATLAGNTTALQAQITALENELAVAQGTIACLRREGNDVIFEGCNVHVRSGAGATNAPVNGLGNLIVGYNEIDPRFPEDRTGSHNLVVGPEHTYSSHGGLVAGFSNEVSGPHASVSGGFDSRASGIGASVSGGDTNVASGNFASVSGGFSNQASGVAASASGGIAHHATGSFHWVAFLDFAAELGSLPEELARATVAGIRTVLAVPLLREGAAIGIIAIRRRVVRPFTDKQIALLQTFADQRSSPSRTSGCSPSSRRRTARS
jgi:GAF domain-containing protein